MLHMNMYIILYLLNVIQIADSISGTGHTEVNVTDFTQRFP